MKQIDHEELKRVIARGQGWVIVHRSKDRQVGRLHHATCEWVKEIRPESTVLYAEEGEPVFKWLNGRLEAKGHRWTFCRTCRKNRGPVLVERARQGKPIARDPEKDFPLQVGDHVLTDWDADYASIVGTPPDAAVARFDGPWAPEVERLSIRLGETSGGGHGIDFERLRRQKLNRGIPCYALIGDDWLSATVLDHDTARREIRVVSQGQNHKIPEADVRVRRTAAIAYPLGALAYGFTGSVEAFNARAAFNDFYQPLAAKARGLEGVLGASVELYAHQLRVVRRVLTDPFQRYLLADEVGLGKTIEAGLIIRQRYLDAPSSVIRIACPEALVAQWSEELDTKIGIRSFRPDGKTIEAYDREDDSSKPFVSAETPDLLVIDEAHRVAAGWGSGDERAEALYSQAAELANRTPRVLLLSATPVLHHERTLLAMLHLLDPDTYRLEEVAEFVQRMSVRERIAEIFALLREDSPAFVLRDAVDDLRGELPEDSEIGRLGTGLLDALQGPPEGSDRTREAIAALRTHVSDTYRVHSRVLRQRRRQVDQTGYSIRGRDGIVCIDPECLVSGDIEAWLNELRGKLVELADEDSTEIGRAATFFRLFLERATGDPAALSALARAAVTRNKTEFLRAGCDRREKAVVREVWHSETLGPICGDIKKLESILERDPNAEDAWIHALWRALGEGSHPEVDVDSGKAVVFATASESAARAAAYFRKRAGTERVEEVTRDMGAEERATAVDNFRDNPWCRFLFADRTAEEGLNLQAADLVAMADLPTDTVRVEQRIGRADRFSRDAPVLCVGLAPVSGGLVDLWLGALRDGFDVFDESAAPIQFAVDQVEREFLRSLFLEGESEVTRDTTRLKEQVEAEQARIDRVDSLDALASAPTREGELIATYQSAESEMPDAVEVLEDLPRAYGPDLGVEIHFEDEQTVEVEAAEQNLITDWYEGVRTRGVRIAQDRSEVRLNSRDELIRPGVPAVETLRRMLDWLPEGQVFAIQASSEDYGSEVFFCCDLLVRADISEVMATWRTHETSLPHRQSALRNAADAPLDAAGFHRWADSYLPPRFVRTWLDVGGKAIADDSLIECLESALVNSSVDDELTDDDWGRVEAIAGVRSLGEIVDLLTKEAERASLETAKIETRPEAATAHFEAEMKLDLAHRRLRADREGSKEALAELQVLEELVPKLAQAIGQPRATWIGAGVLMLSGEGVEA